MQATSAQLARLNALRRARGYVEIHPEDWVGITHAKAEVLIRQWTAVAPARR